MSDETRIREIVREELQADRARLSRESSELGTAELCDALLRGFKSLQSG